MTSKYYVVEPEVAGGLGPNTVMDSGTHPPRVEKLNYEFFGWLGDSLVETFPCYVVTKVGSEQLRQAAMTGMTFDEVEVTLSDEFEELYPDTQLPEFVWMRVGGAAGKDDFGISKDFRLVVSQRALDVLKSLGLSNATIKDF